MTARYTIVIPGVAHGKGRLRTFANRPGGYTPTATHNAEAWVKSCAIQQIGQPMMETPIEVVVGIDVAVPASWSKKRREAALRGEVRPTGKPDLDNCTKLLMDALNKIAWRDDAQVVKLAVAKRYAHAPQTIVEIFEVLP
jgi:Holliday junction resolvase RusA-like endonuclease